MVLYIKTDIKPSDISLAKFGGFHALSANNHSSDAGFYVVACERYHKITVSVNIHTVTLKNLER
jgi:hypothetical protein